LLFLGGKAFLSVPKAQNGAPAKRRMTNFYLSTLVLTLSNPLTIVSFAAVFGGLGIAGKGNDYATSAALVSGVFSGSALWWVTLSGGVGVFRGALSPSRLRWVNRASGVVISAFGVIILLTLLL